MTRSAEGGRWTFAIIAIPYLWLLAFLLVPFVLIIAYPLAYGLTRAPGRWRNLLFTLVILPFWTSFLVRIYAWITILKPNGFLDIAGQLLGLDAGSLALLNTNAAVLIGIVYS